MGDNLKAESQLLFNGHVCVCAVCLHHTGPISSLQQPKEVGGASGPFSKLRALRLGNLPGEGQSQDLNPDCS